MNTFLSNCIRLLMEDSIKDDWYNSFNFLTYNEDKYTNGDLNERRRKINHYTGALEDKLHIDWEEVIHLIVNVCLVLWIIFLAV